MTSRRSTPATAGMILLLLPLAACDDDPLDSTEVQVAWEDLVDGDAEVTLDPSGYVPLAAAITLRSLVPTVATLTVLGDEPLELVLDDAATEHEIPLLGLYPGTVNQVEVRIHDLGTSFAIDTLEITTEPLPDFLPDIEVVVADRERMEPGWTLASLSIGQGDHFATWPIMFDANGDIRWYMDLSRFGDMTYLVERLDNGNLVTGYASAIQELDMLGQQVRDWDIPGWSFHHDVIEKPDGNLIVAVNRAGGPTVEDHVIEIDRTTSAVVRVWDLRESLDPNRRNYMNNDVDWFHMNAIWYDEEDDALILSGRNQSAVVKVSGDNELIWILGAHEGWGPAGVNGDGPETADFLLTAVADDGNPFSDAVQRGQNASAEFRWPWGQHAPLLLPNGNLFLFDNGLNRLFDPAAPKFSRGVEYAIDESNLTVRQIWQYGEERGEEFYSSIISDVDYLPETGNRLIMPGLSNAPGLLAYVTEVSYPDGQIVFEAKILFKNALTEGTQMRWGNFDLVYRSERMTLYPD